MPHRRWADRARVIGEHALLAAALGVSLASAIALAARACWFAELFTHFRVQYLAVQLPLVIALGWRRRIPAALLMLPLVIVNLLAVAAYWPRAGATPAIARSFALMTVNLNAGNLEVERFLTLVGRERPDAIVLLEVNAAWVDALAALADEYPGRWVESREDAFGIAVLSRRALVSPQTLELRGAPAIDTGLALGDDRAVRLLGVHLRTPVSRTLAGERNAQLVELSEIVAETAEPLIVTGDFNVTPYSPVLADWLDRTQLTDPRRGRGFGLTWPTFLPILGIPIDHCFTSAHFIAAAPRRSVAFGSDHFAITTNLSLRDD